MHRQERLKTVRAALSAWFKRHKRDLPWRGSQDPYAIWVSEVMLQQTRVETVKPYYKRFLKSFPDVQTLAHAPLGAVLRVWEGLGYYGRARNLHRAAKEVVRKFDCRLPESTAELRKLPGIGPYSAGAIASIAFGLDEPVLDGNVTRVLCRVFRIRENPTESAIRKKLWKLAGQLVPKGRAGLFNQALMDLGATLCIPRRPNCEVCPLEALCQAQTRGEENRLPRVPKRKPVPHHDVVAGIIRKDGRILIDRRREGGLLGGLWEFPGGKRRTGESLGDALMREVAEELNVTVKVLKPLPTVRHAYSHFRITLHCFECSYVSGRPKAVGCAGWKWVEMDELGDYAFPRANRKVIEALAMR